MHPCRRSPRAGIGLEASTIPLSVSADKSGSIRPPMDDECIEHGIIETGSDSFHAKAVRYGTLMSRKDMDPIGGLSDF